MVNWLVVRAHAPKQSQAAALIGPERGCNNGRSCTTAMNGVFANRLL